MRIVIDMQGAQTESRFRGIGRYTMAFAKAVVRNRGEHEIILALSGLFPETIEPIRAAFKDFLPQSHIRVWEAPGPVRQIDVGNEDRREIAELLREVFLTSLQPDVIHIPSLFEGYVDDAVVSIGQNDNETSVSVTIHDLIPLLNAEQYLDSNEEYKRYYLRKIDSLNNVQIFLAISESSKVEVLNFLDLERAEIVNTSEAAEDCFQKIEIDDKAIDKIYKNFSITRSFVLYTGGADERKNLPRLIEAYAKLPGGLREKHQLVFAGKMPDVLVSNLKYLAEKNGLKQGELLFTGYVSDKELVQLYNLCSLFVFPSWHEGFGLPALEAMACGAPVLGANTSSLPEVIALPEALFDPLDATAISQKMAEVLNNDGFCTKLREHGLEQAKRFSWDETAIRAIRAWEKLPSRRQAEVEVWRQTSERLFNHSKKLIETVAALFSESPASNEAQLRSIATSLAKNEQQLDGYFRPKSLPSQITWRIEGPFDSTYSLALVNREVARALENLGHRVVLHSTEGPGDFHPDENYLKDNNDLQLMYRRSDEVKHIDADVVSRNLYPPRVSDMTARLNFLHAYGWEESGFPLDWVDTFNASLQGMTVMSDHVRKIMIDHGVTVPVELSSLGVDHWNRIEPDDSLCVDARSFRFLHVSSCFPRKGADVLLRSYGRAFRAYDDVSLVIKTFPNPHNEINRWLEDARMNDPDFPEVIILEGDFTDEQLKALYEQCHVLVAPSRAEGFGLPMAEAMLSGLAVITTGWSGQTDFCTSDTAWLIDYTFARAKTHFGLSASVWAEPDETHLAQLMRDVYLMPTNLRHSRIKTGQKLLNENFRWVDVASRMVVAARKWAVGGEKTCPRIGWVTTWNTRCGIATYSEHLINSMQSPVSILAQRTAEKTAEDASNVLRCWSAGEDETLVGLSLQIAEQAVDTLVIQFNYGFFNLTKFAHFLEDQIGKGLIIVVVMHATNDPVHVPHKKLSLLATSLKLCHRVLVHSPNDMNRLKNLGVVENVALFPHGLLEYVPAPNGCKDSGRDLVVASYGFFLPHKGLLELIDAIAILRDQEVPVCLKMVNAEFPAVESKIIIEEAKKKIKRLHLDGQVSMCTDFLSDDESLAKLASADLVVFPYQATGESASGAVRYGIASGRPVAVTPLDIFDDVAQAVHVLPGTSPDDIAKGIALLVDQLEKEDSMVRKKEDQAERWRAEHRYTNVGQRLNQMLIALHNQAD